MDSKHFLILTSVIFFSAPLWGDSYTVSNNNDSGPNTLRQAILDLNATGNTATNTITIDSGLPPILLNSKLPVIQKNVTITASGTNPQIINGNKNRLFVANADLTLKNCDIQNGTALGGNGISDRGSGGGGGLGAGGGVYVAPNNTVTLNKTSFTNNLAKGGKGANGFQNLFGGGFSGSGGGASFSSADPNASRTQGGGDNPGQHGNSGNPPARGGNKGGDGGESTPAFTYNKISFIPGGLPNEGLDTIISTIYLIVSNFYPNNLTPNFNITDGQSASSSKGLGRGGGQGGSTTGSIYEFLTSDAPINGGAGGIGGAGGGGGGGAYVAQPPMLFEQVVSPFEDEIGYQKIQLVSQPGNGGDEGGGGGAAGIIRNGGGGGGYGGGGGGGSSATLDLSTEPKKRGETPGLAFRTAAQVVAQLAPITGLGSGGGGGGFGGGGGGGGGDITYLSGGRVEYKSGGGGGFKFLDPIVITVGRKIPYQGGGGGGGGGFGGGGGGSAAFIQEDIDNLEEITGKEFVRFKDGRVSQGGRFGGAGGGEGRSFLFQRDNPYAGSGGGGAGIGGAIFVANNARLIIQDSVSLSGNQTEGGAAGIDSGGGSYPNRGGSFVIPAEPGKGFADDIFLYSDAELIFQNENTLLADFSIQSDPQSLPDIGIRKEGSGAVIMTSEKNNYQGATVINEGTISIASDVLGNPSSQLIFEGGTLEATDTFSLGRAIILNSEGTISVNPSHTLTINSIEGEGSLTKTDDGTLILTALATEGNLIIDEGIVQGNSSSIQKNVLINNLGTLVFDQESTGTYVGKISGTGGLDKIGNGTLSFIGVDNFTGSTGVAQGTLVIPEGEHFSSENIVIVRNATLQNNGTITTNVLYTYGKVVGEGMLNISIMYNIGRVSAGNSIGTLTINGNYMQDASGTLGVEIDATGAANLLNVTGTAILDGNVDVTPNPGIYLKGTTYTFLTAGAVTGQFSNLFSDPLNYTINYLPNQAQLFLTTSSIILGIPNSSLIGNARSVADYLFCQFDFTDTDRVVVANALLRLSMDEYAKALNRLTPTAFGALPLVELENNFNLANTFFVAGVGQRSYCYADVDEPTNIWFNPLGFVYSQDGHKEAPGFTAHTYGAVVGADRVFLDEWSLGVGFGYSHAQLNWTHHVCHAYADSIYLGPYIKYDCGNFYFDFLLLGAGNFYDVDRKIVFPGLSRKAHSDPTTWNLSEILLAGLRLEPFYVDNFFVQPEIRLDQTNSFQEKFKETGAQSLDLSVKDKRSSFLRSLVNIKVTKESCVAGFCLVPSINLGWLRTTPLTRSHYISGFRGGTFLRPDFTTSSFHQTIDQFLVGAQFLVTQGALRLSIGYEGVFGKRSTVNEMNINVHWNF